MPVLVRPRVDSDLPILVAALGRVHRADGYPVHVRNVTAAWLTPKDMQSAWTTTIDGRPAGHVALERTAGGLVVARLFLDTTDRGRGLADLLLDAVQAAAGPEPLTLEVHVTAAAAIARYERRGWVRTGVHEAAWTDTDGAPALAYSYRAPQPRPTAAPRRAPDRAADGGPRVQAGPTGPPPVGPTGSAAPGSHRHPAVAADEHPIDTAATDVCAELHPPTDKQWDEPAKRVYQS